MLTAQYIAYAKNVYQGLSEKQSLSTEWLLPRKKITTQQLLDSLVNGNNKFQNLPMYRQYNLLKDYLKKYNGIKNPSELLAIKGNKKTYKLSDSAAVIADIRERLFLLEDIATNNHSLVFDSLLETGVKTIVLGCTHYPLLLPTLQEVASEYSDVKFVDPAQAVAREVFGCFAVDASTPAGNERAARDVFYVSGAQDGVSSWIQKLLDEAHPQIETGPIFTLPNNSELEV